MTCLSLCHLLQILVWYWLRSGSLTLEAWTDVMCLLLATRSGFVVMMLCLIRNRKAEKSSLRHNPYKTHLLLAAYI